MAGKDRINSIMQKAGKTNAQQGKFTGITKDFLIIRTGESLLGLQIEYLREVFDLVTRNEIIPLPFVPPYLFGIINVRGEIVPVVSLSRVLGLEETADESLKMVIIEEKFKLSFPVDEIMDLKTIDMNLVRPVKDSSKKPEDFFLTQEFIYQDRAVGIVDIIKFFASTAIMENTDDGRKA